MGKIKLYNSLNLKDEVFKPIKKGQVGMYSCGPTVWNYAHIGNFRTYIFNDLLRKSLEYNGLKVRHVMNITDVDDKTIKGSQKEGLSLTEFTRKYEKIFFDDLSSLNIVKPSVVLRATESIPQMISLIEKLIKKKYAYKAEDGIYFSIEKFKDYGKLAQLEKVKKTKSRVLSDNYDKDNPQDFALWKFYAEEDGDVSWDAPFGKGRPGWHIECSAMSMSSLGDRLDIHTGAIDLKFPHHTNEIAQSEAATGKKFVNYWVHGGFLTIKDSKMSKSLGNIYTLKDIESQGFDPIHYRYFCLLTHYRKPLNFSTENLEAAKQAYERIKRRIIDLKKDETKGLDRTEEYEKKFLESINNDLNIPESVQVFIKALEDKDFDAKKKLSLLTKFDSVLGLGVENIEEQTVLVSSEVQNLVESRERLRKEKKWAEADIVRQRIKDKGYNVSDTPQGPKIEKI